MPPALLHLANLLWLTTVLTALYRARRQLPRLQPVAIHLFCGAIPVLTLLTLLKTAAAPGLELHLIGLTATTLLMGARLAILAAAFSQLLLLALGELPPATLGLSGLTHAADDAAALDIRPLAALRAADYGLASIRQAIATIIREPELLS